MSSVILLSRPRPGVGLVTFNRPQRLNAIDPELDAATAAALRELQDDAAVRCIVLTGAGDKAFCAGADIPTYLPMLRGNIEAGRDDPQVCGLTHRATTTKPLLAAINGLALGGGLEVALACDLRIASDNARFGLPEIRLGLLAGGGGCTRLPRTVPAALAAEMILTGEPIGAQRALEAGLVSRVVPAAALMDTALELAQAVAARAPMSLRACTELLRRARYDEVQDALAHERRLFAALMQSQDGREGVTAFAEKRTPTWRDA